LEGIVKKIQIVEKKRYLNLLKVEAGKIMI